LVAGLGFKIDEIVQAWHEMHDAKRWIQGVQSFRLEPLFRRRVPKLHHVLEHMWFIWSHQQHGIQNGFEVYFSASLLLHWLLIVYG